MKNKKRKILFFLPDYPLYTTGGIMYAVIIYEYLIKKIDNVGIFGKNIFTKYVNKSKLLKIFFGFYYFVALPKGTIIVTTNTEYFYFTIPVILFKRIKNIFIFNIIHHLLADEKTRKYRDRLEKYYILKSDFITTVSNDTFKRLIEIGVNKNEITLIKPGLKHKYEGNILEIKTFTANKILFVGTIEKRKGVIILIEALKKAELYNFELNIVGRIVMRDYYDKILKKIKEYGFENKIKFYSNLDSEELKSLYTDSYLFVFPSFMEGYGMVIMEAMSHANLVISSRIPSIEEILEDGKEGVLFEPGNVDKLAELIKYYFNNREAAKQIAIKGYEKSKYFDDWNSVSERYLKIFEELTYVSE